MWPSVCLSFSPLLSSSLPRVCLRVVAEKANERNEGENERKKRTRGDYQITTTTTTSQIGKENDTKKENGDAQLVEHSCRKDFTAKSRRDDGCRERWIGRSFSLIDQVVLLYFLRRWSMLYYFVERCFDSVVFGWLNCVVGSFSTHLAELNKSM